MVLAIGIVVDDAIVVLENIYHRIEEGEPPLAAAFNGARQVGFAIISTTMVVCAVFVPIMFIAGQTGLLFRELAAAMIGAVAFSGFFALSLAPMLCSKLLRHESRGRFAGWIDSRFRALEARYAGGLDRVIRKPLLPVGVVFLFLAGAGFLFMTLRSELVPAEDAGIIQVSVTAPEGTSYDQMSRYMDQVQARLMPMVGQGSVRSLITRVPGGFGPSEDFNSGSFILFLKPWEERTVSTADVAARVNREIAQVAAVRGNAQVRNSLNRGRGQQINFVIAGTTYDELVRARDRILAAAASNPGIINLDSDYKENKPQLPDPGRYRARRRSRRLCRGRVQRPPDAARLASESRPTRTAAANIAWSCRPSRMRGPRSTISPRSMCAAAPARWCRSPTSSAPKALPARATSAATTSCGRSRSPAASHPATRSARR